MEVTFKSKHINTISFSQDGFVSLLDKDFEYLTCHMSNGDVIKVSRSTLTRLWAQQRKLTTLRNGFIIKVLNIR